MSTSKTAVTVNAVLGKILSAAGYSIGGLSLLILVFSTWDLSTEADVFVAFIIFIALSCIPIGKGIQIKRRIKRFKKYVSLISTENMTSLENIAASTSQSVDFVRNDLQKMIDKKFFANAHIDVKANEIVIGGRRVAVSEPVRQSTQTSQTIDAMETIHCSGCGALNSKQKGKPGSCEYCGSPLVK